MNNLEYIAEVRQIVREAGKTVRKHFGKIDRYETKSTQFDPVTEIDRGVEQYLKQAFTSLIPQSRFLAEETASEMKSAKYLWIIDPIDGTINFLHGFPFVCVSVALYIDDKPYYGIVFDPIRDELFEAAPGKGSFLNDKRIRVSKKHEARTMPARDRFSLRLRHQLREQFPLFQPLPSEGAGHPASGKRGARSVLRRLRQVRRLLGMAAQSVGRCGRKTDRRRGGRDRHQL